MEKPDKCGNCDSANLRLDKVEVRAEYGGHLENGEMTQPEFLQPMPISFDVDMWICDDCDAQCPDMDAISNRIVREIQRAIGETN
jgi:hypothetical protein